MEKALNLIYLSPKHAGGKDQVALNLLKGLQDIGVAKEYEIICWDYSLETLRCLAPDAQYRVLKSKSQHGRELERVLKIVYINTIILPKIIKEDHIRVLFHASCTNGLVKLPAKTVVIPHDIKAISHRVIGSVRILYYKYLIYKVMYALDFKHADGIIAITDFDKQEISSYYPQYAQKVKRIYNPILIDACQFRKQDTKKYITAINIQFHHKNIITLIKAYKIIKGKIPYKLALIGNIPERVRYLKDYAEQNDLEDDIVFTGFISDERVNDILSQSALYVNPSLFEGFGMTAVESMIKKIPTLVSDIPANREVTFSMARYYTDLQNPEALAVAILDALDAPPAEEYLEQAKEKMLNAFEYRVIAREYHEFFSAL